MPTVKSRAQAPNVQGALPDPNNPYGGQGTQVDPRYIMELARHIMGAGTGVPQPQPQSPFAPQVASPVGPNSHPGLTMAGDIAQRLFGRVGGLGGIIANSLTDATLGRYTDAERARQATMMYRQKAASDYNAEQSKRAFELQKESIMHPAPQPKAPPKTLDQIKAEAGARAAGAAAGKGAAPVRPPTGKILVTADIARRNGLGPEFVGTYVLPSQLPNFGAASDSVKIARGVKASVVAPATKVNLTLLRDQHKNALSRSNNAFLPESQRMKAAAQADSLAKEIRKAGGQPGDVPDGYIEIHSADGKQRGAIKADAPIPAGWTR